MNVGALATVASMAPDNLTIICIDNGCHGETGGQPGHTSRRTSLAMMAEGAGIPSVLTIASEGQLAEAARFLAESPAPRFLWARGHGRPARGMETQLEPLGVPAQVPQRLSRPARRRAADMTRPCPDRTTTRGRRGSRRAERLRHQAHVFGPASQFPYADGRGYTPPDCPIDDYLRLLDTLGLDRGVIVHGSAHGSDNRVSLHGIATAPDRLRGVAVVDPAISDDELEALAEGGMRASGCRPCSRAPTGPTC